MTPSARIQASIELLDQIFDAWQSEKRFPADKLLEKYFKSCRYIGSKDRGAVAELIYWVLRHKATIEWWLGKYSQNLSGRFFIITALILRGDCGIENINNIFSGERFSPNKLTDNEINYTKKIDRNLHGNDGYNQGIPEHVRLNYPQWMEDKLRASFGDKISEAMNALNEQAPTDLRVNTLKTNRDKLIKDLQAEGFECAPAPFSPIGIRLTRRAPIFTSKFFKDGHFEVQDAGSQALALLVDAKAGQRVIDFCAGAGGKTLAIAAMMENKGRILAWDTSKKRLDQINVRLKRAGIHNVQTHVLESEHDSFIKRHKATADRVLVDAPCSGSGTWRRNPDLKWRFNNNDLEEVIKIQHDILQSAARLVKAGGKLIYATCSVFLEENEMQIDRFLQDNPNFKIACYDNKQPYFRVTPHEHGVDGFFAATLEKQG